MIRGRTNVIRKFLVGVTLAASVIGGAMPALAQDRPRRSFYRDDKPNSFRDNPRMLAAFREVVAQPSRSVVRVRADGRDVAMGTIVGADGWVLTKNSEIPEDVKE